MTPPIEGMTVRPMGEDYMAGAFIGCLNWAAHHGPSVKRFQLARPDIVIPLPARTPMEAMIDKAAGANRTIAIAFADWVATEIWGVEGECEEITGP